MGMRLAKKNEHVVAITPIREWLTPRALLSFDEKNGVN